MKNYLVIIVLLVVCCFTANSQTLGPVQTTFDINVGNADNPSKFEGIKLPIITSNVVSNSNGYQKGMMVFFDAPNLVEKGVYYWDNMWKPFYSLNMVSVDESIATYSMENNFDDNLFFNGNSITNHMKKWNVDAVTTYNSSTYSIADKKITINTAGVYYVTGTFVFENRAPGDYRNGVEVAIVNDANNTKLVVGASSAANLDGLDSNNINIAISGLINATIGSKLRVEVTYLKQTDTTPQNTSSHSIKAVKSGSNITLKRIK